MSEEKIDLEVLITLKGRTAASRIKLLAVKDDFL